MKLAGRVNLLLTRPWIWSYLGALLVWLAAIAFTRGYGAGGMVTTWDGGSAQNGGRIIAAGDARVHEEALKLLNT